MKFRVPHHPSPSKYYSPNFRRFHVLIQTRALPYLSHEKIYMKAYSLPHVRIYTKICAVSLSSL